MSGLWNFSVRVQPDPIKLNPIQTWSAKFLKIISPLFLFLKIIKIGFSLDPAPVLIWPKLASVLIQSDPVLTRAHLYQVHVHLWPFSCIRDDKERQGIYFLCCDHKAWTASAQSFTLWQQAVIKITRRDHPIIACSRHTYLCVAVCAHPICGESHIQRNANREFATTSPPSYNEPHLSHVLSVKVAPGTTFTSWSQHHFIDMSRSANTYAQSVNLIHSVLWNGEGVTQARGCLRHEAGRGLERWHCTIYCNRLLRRI